MSLSQDYADWASLLFIRLFLFGQVRDAASQMQPGSFAPACGVSPLGPSLQERMLRWTLTTALLLSLSLALGFPPPVQRGDSLTPGLPHRPWVLLKDSMM